MSTRSSLLVILSAGGARLDRPALDELPLARVLRADFARGERTACVAATLEHECSITELRGALKPWAAGRGWLVTVAPGPRGD